MELKTKRKSAIPATVNVTTDGKRQKKANPKHGISSPQPPELGQKNALNNKRGEKNHEK